MVNNNNFSTFAELVEHYACQQPKEIAFSFLGDSENNETDAISYHSLVLQAKAIAAHLQNSGLVKQRVLLFYPPGIEFITAFLGCFYAGVIPIPAYPPRFTPQDIHRVINILNDSGAAAILSIASLSDSLQKLFANLHLKNKLHWINTDTIDSDDHADWKPQIIDPQSIAFLQYTSGSTGAPKGVMVSHANLMHNEQMIAKAFGHNDETVVVGWLPFYHDMGLIGNVLQPLYLGRHCILMSPLAFLQKPWRWLKAISDYQATTSGGPNFAYDLCVRKITPEHKATMDLSHWRLAFNGAEPVRAEVMDRFANYFADCGFQRKAFYPCYGMAETTLLLTGGNHATEANCHHVDRKQLEKNRVLEVLESAADKHTVVSCGSSWLDQEILIVDPKTQKRCDDDEIGEIWVKGPSVTMGYWNKPELTKEIFHARLRDTKEGPYLRTGDLGYIHQGELFVNGRLKDVIIIRGRNRYPEDIEFTVQSAHEALRPGCGAAFSVEVDAEEKLVFVQEIKRQYLNKIDIREIVGFIRQEISRYHGLQAQEICLLRPGTLPKTSSGKIQRNLCKEMFMTKQLKVIETTSITGRFDFDLVTA